MSVLLRDRSIAFRLRDRGRIVAEAFGPLHDNRRTLLEWGSVTKTVTAVLTSRLSAQGTVDPSAPVSDTGPGRPCGWMRSATLWWHNGHNRDQGAFVGISDTGERVVTVHAVGHRVGASDRIATRLAQRHPC